MIVYFDSSALAKKYIRETGTDTVILWCQKATEVVMSVLTIPEFFSALNRRLREKEFGIDIYKNIRKEFLLDIEETRMVDLSTEIIHASIVCMEKNSLKTLDSLHIATAIDQEVECFITADKKQALVAKKMGLSVELV